MSLMTLDFTLDPEQTPLLIEEILACWTDVSNAGGAVGFVPPVTTEDVRPTAQASLRGVGSGRDRLVVGRADGRLAALAFLVDDQFSLSAHWRTVKGVMVHPDFQKRGYGHALMARVEQLARETGLEFLRLNCRGGTGNDEFYRKCGYVEIGRFPRALKLPGPIYLDQISMALTL
jgi:GNAT superfamily N-acetyltransferase